jgi:hypothetical protein
MWRRKEPVICNAYFLYLILLKLFDQAVHQPALRANVDAKKSNSNNNSSNTNTSLNSSRIFCSTTMPRPVPPTTLALWHPKISRRVLRVINRESIIISSNSMVGECCRTRPLKLCIFRRNIRFPLPKIRKLIKKPFFSYPGSPSPAGQP